MTASRPEAPADTHAASARRRADFAAELLRCRLIAELSQAELGDRMGYNRTYINKVERGALDPTAGFASKADEALGLKGDLYALWRSFEAARGGGLDRRRRPPSSSEDMTADVLVDHDEAWLSRRLGTYDLHMRKVVVNVGQTPVLRYFMRVAVDRFPDDTRRSNDSYRANPITVAELDLQARCGDEPMEVHVAEDRDSSKEIWLLFKNAVRVTALPGQGHRDRLHLSCQRVEVG